MGRLRVKICGVTTADDARAAADAGADAVGLNFFQGSPRFVEPRRAAELVRALPPWVAPVGVFVNQPLRQCCAVAYQFGLRAVQWHGDAPPTDDPFPFALVAAFRIRDRASLDAVTRYLDAGRARGVLPSAVLVDAHVEGQHGGTGRVAPWELLADFRPGVPLILAGGLTPENVAEAGHLGQPYGVGGGRGVESAPRREDAQKKRRLLRNAPGAAAWYC